MVKHIIYGLLFVGLFWNCSTDGEQQTAEDLEVAVPSVPYQSPETIVREYQAHLDNNEFEAAKKLSTSTAQDRLEEIADIISEEPADSTLFTTNFIDIQCDTTLTSAICACIIEYQANRFPDTFYLVRKAERWLIDAPKETIDYDYNEEVEEFLEDELSNGNE
ncbi:MAG: hypothetical protein AAGI23_12740 [Bacteroidota bacterium]